MNAALRDYCLRILPPKMSVPKATSFENKTPWKPNHISFAQRRCWWCQTLIDIVV